MCLLRKSALDTVWLKGTSRRPPSRGSSPPPAPHTDARPVCRAPELWGTQFEKQSHFEASGQEDFPAGAGTGGDQQDMVSEEEAECLFQRGLRP